MDDIASMITQFLNSEDGMNQLKAVSAALGIPDPTAPQQSNGFQPQSNFQPQQNMGQPIFSPQSGQNPPNMPQLDMKTLMMMQKAMSLFGQEDKNTELLRALKPHFSPERARKVDDAIHIMQLIRLLPLAKEMGILGRSKGGDR